MASSNQRIMEDEFLLPCPAPSSLLTTHYSLLTPPSPLHQCAIIQPPVEPVLIAADVLLHRNVHIGLEDRDARHVRIGEIDEALHVLLVLGLVADRGCVDRAVDHRVELLR